MAAQVRACLLLGKVNAYFTLVWICLRPCSVCSVRNNSLSLTLPNISVYIGSFWHMSLVLFRLCCVAMVTWGEVR